jgi:hypothetical protein
VCAVCAHTKKTERTRTRARAHTHTHTHTQVVLGAINSTELWDYYRAHGFPHAFKSGRNQTDPALRGIDRPALQALAKRYSDDFANLGFPAPGGAIV